MQESACPSAKNNGPVTTGRWPMSPCTFLLPTRNLLEGRNSKGARGAATRVRVRKEKAQPASCLWLLPHLATLGTKGSSVSYCTPRMREESLAHSLLFPLAQTGTHFSEDKAVWVDAASSAQVQSVEDAGERGYQSGALNVGSNAQELAEM